MRSTQPKVILVATDFSKTAEEALRYASAVAERIGVSAAEDLGSFAAMAGADLIAAGAPQKHALGDFLRGTATDRIGPAQRMPRVHRECERSAEGGGVGSRMRLRGFESGEARRSIDHADAMITGESRVAVDGEMLNSGRLTGRFCAMFRGI